MTERKSSSPGTLAGITVASEAARLLAALRSSGLTISFAESCTGGLAASSLASVPLASEALWGAIVAYAPEAKTELLGLDAGMIREAGAVSRRTAESMALAMLDRAGTDLAGAITGYAGPGGGDSESPVGTVWLAVAVAGKPVVVRRFVFPGTRTDVREHAVIALFRECLAAISD